MKNTENRIYYGNAYYPEAWDKSDIETDIDKMFKLGFNTVRVGEFAWADMQPSENVFDFSTFRKVVDYCKQKGMYVLMCTPTACPPAWLVEKHPEVLIQNGQGRRLVHGARRNTCTTNEEYLKACDKIAEAMAKEFSKDENIIGWQIDNEIYVNHGGGGCKCEKCRSTYHDFLKRTYGTIENLNKEWDTYVWSMRFDNFSQVEPPNGDIWNHPSVKSVWKEFQNELITKFIHRQYDIIKKYTDVPVSTDMMPLLGLSYDDVCVKADVVQYNHYHEEKNLWTLGLWCDFMRSQKDKAFWVTETSPNWNGSEFANYTRPQGFSCVNTMLPMALGSQMTSYWLWKTHYGGHEIMHGAVIDSWGREAANIDEIKRMGKEMKILEPHLLSTKVKQNRIAVHFTHSAWQIFRTQSIVPEFDYQKAIENLIYRPLAKKQIRADFIGASHSLDNYEILISPFTVCLDEHNAFEKTERFVRGGGTWIVLPLTDMRTLSGAKYRNAPLGHIEEFADIKLEFMLPKGENYEIVCEGGKKIQTHDFVYYALKCGKNAESVAKYDKGFPKGKSAITRTKVGKGQVIVIGAILQDADWSEFVSIASERFGIESDKASENVLTVRRDGEEEMFCAFETENKKGFAVMPYASENVLTGKTYKEGEKIAMNEYDYIFAKKSNI